MTYTENQGRISQAMLSVLRNLNHNTVTQIQTYLGDQDTTANLNTLCTALKGNLSGANIAVTGAIEQVLQVCEIIHQEQTVGDTVFYHSDRSHSFYTCNGPDHNTLALLYTTTPELSSFEAARNLCYVWTSTNDDLYGSYNPAANCIDLLPLDTLALQTCLAGMDYPTS